VRRDGRTAIDRFDPVGPLFDDKEVTASLSAADDGRFEGLLLRGFIDA
jgi:hypothetical protein